MALLRVRGNVHHSLRQVVTGVLSRVAGLLAPAVLYSAAAGVDI